MNRTAAARAVSCLLITAAIQQVCKAAATLNEVQNFTTTGNISSVIYSSQYNLLFLRDSTTDIRVLNATTGAQVTIRTPSATGAFTDFALSPSGRYLYAADYGGTNIGYDTPLYPSYVDRYDLQTGTWTSAQAPAIGYRIAPVDDSNVLLLGVDQWVDLTLNTYAPGSMTQLSKISPGYSGNIEYNANLNRIFYNETGLSSESIKAFTLSGSNMTLSQTIAGASYGNYLGLLSSDGNTFYYGQEAVKASDITKTLATFSETITAASPTMAFGSAHFYDANTGAALGNLSYSPITWTVGANGKDAWAIQQPSGGSATIHHFVIAQSSAWNATTGGSWADTTKWTPNGLPDGMDNTADLSQVTLAADATVTLDGNHTVGHLLFGDLGAKQNWKLAPGSGGVLTLQDTAGIPNITVNNQTTTISAPIDGTQGLLKDGNGTLVLSAHNTYTGGTTVANGTLVVSSDTNLDSGTLTINTGTFRAAGNLTSSRAIVLGAANSSIQVDAGFSYTALTGATVSGTGGLTKTGAGTLDLSAAPVTYTGNTTVNAGTLILNTLTSTGQITVASGAAMNVSGANLTLGAINNSGAISFSNATGAITTGTLTGNGTTNFAAGANIPTLSSGTITVAGAANITTAAGGTANLNGATASISTLSNTVVNLASGTALTVSAGAQTAGGISGAGNLTKTGIGTLILGVDNLYTGGTTIAAGTLQIGNGAATGTILGNVTNNGTLAFGRSDAFTFSGLISGTGSVRQNGTGTLTLSNANNYTGGTTVNSGTLLVAADSSLGTGSLSIAAGTFRAAASIASARPISLTSTTSAIQVDPTFTYTAQPGSTVSGTGGLTKLGTGTLDLTTASVTYTGTTTVNAGALILNTLTSTGQITVASGAALNIGGTNLTLGALNNSGNISFTATTGAITTGTITGNGTTNFAASANIPTLSSGAITVAGAANITTANAGTANLNGPSATIGTLSNTTLNLAPGTALSVAAGTQLAGGITGAGSLTKTGAGTLILAADNSLPAGTTIAAGTLQIGNGAAAGSITGNIVDNASLLFNRSDNYTFSGLISGNGSVRQNGTGTLTLTNADTFTGGITVASGTLQLGDGIFPGSVTGNITNNGTVIFNTPAAGQLTSGSLSGSGAITKIGPGTQILTGNNTNTGSTTVSAGALQIGNGGTIGSITGNVLNNAALIFNRSDNITAPGTITGSGHVEQAGGGTLTLSANVTNALLASNGRILVGPGSTVIGDVTTAAGGRVENGGGTLHIANLDNAGILSGTADLTGTFNNRATGDVRLAAGQSMYLQSAATHTNAGLLEVIGNASSQASFEAVGPMTNASGGSSMITARYGSLRFDAGLTNQGALSFSYGTTDVFGYITNAAGGTITVAGGAGVTFYDDVVQNGTLNVSAVGATHSSAVFFGSLTGSGGATGGGDVFIMGDLRPGSSSPAVATYSGNLFLAPSSHTVMDIGSGNQADQINVTGSLGLAGQLNVVLDNNFTPAFGQTFTLFNAASTTGTFSALSLPTLPAGWGFDLTYSPTAVTATVALLGDANLDNKVDLADLSIVLQNFGQPSLSWSHGNFDYAPTIDLTDLADVLNNLNQTFTPVPAQDSGLKTQDFNPTPEPTSLTLLALGALPLLRRRKK